MPLHLVLSLCLVVFCAYAMVRVWNIRFDPGCPMCGAKSEDMHADGCHWDKRQ